MSPLRIVRLCRTLITLILLLPLAARAQERIVVAYVTSGAEDLPDMSLMTHINYAFGHVNKTFNGVRIQRPERLREIAEETREMRNNIMGYTLPNGKHVYVLAEGRLVNLAAGDGHPAEIMDMSFAIQALSAKYLAENEGKITEKLLDVPREVDLEVAHRKLSFLGIRIDTLTPEQEAYLNNSGI